METTEDSSTSVEGQPVALTSFIYDTRVSRYAGNADGLVGVALADRFTEHVSKFFDDRWTPASTWGDFARAVGRAPTRSTLSIHDGAWASPPWRDAPIAAFFAAPPAHHLTPWPP